METINNFIKLSYSTQVAVFSFVLGTILFAFYWVFPRYGDLVFIGLIYVMLAIFINSIVLVMLLYRLLAMPEERKHTCIRIMILLANIPIAVLYFLLITKQFN